MRNSHILVLYKNGRESGQIACDSEDEAIYWGEFALDLCYYSGIVMLVEAKDLEDE